MLQSSGQTFTPHRPPTHLLKKTIRSSLRSNVLLVLHTGLYLSGVEWYITLFPFLQMSLILIIRNEHKMAFSPLKIIPLPAQNCLFTVQNWLTNFYVSQLKNWSPRLFVWYFMKDIIFFVSMICLLLEAKCDLLEAKNVLKSIFNISFQAQLCDIGNVSSLASHENICWTAEGNVICNFEKMQSWTFTSLHCLLETLQSKLQLKSPENRIKKRSCVTTLVIC